MDKNTGQPDKSHVTYNSDGSVSIDVKAAAQQYARNRRAREYPKDPVTNGVVQPAQPCSGEVKRYLGRITELEPSPVQHVVLASDYDRLQSALTAAQLKIKELEQAVEDRDFTLFFGRDV